jgi:hypothetical protein
MLKSEWEEPTKRRANNESTTTYDPLEGLTLEQWKEIVKGEKGLTNEAH